MAGHLQNGGGDDLVHLGLVGGVHIALGYGDMDQKAAGRGDEGLTRLAAHPPVALGHLVEQHPGEGPAPVGVGATLHGDEIIGETLGQGRLGRLVEGAGGIAHIHDRHGLAL